MDKMKIETTHGPVSVIDGGGSGPSVLMIHGNSLNAALFYPLLSSRLAGNYRLVAFDLPGHGDSPRAVNPGKDYGLAAYASMVRELVRVLGLGVPVLFGHSLGGHIAMQALAGGLECRGLFIVGTPPLGSPPDYAAAFNLAATGDWMFRAELPAEEIKKTAAACMPPGVPVPVELALAIASTDPRARLELGIAMGRDILHDEAAFQASWPRPVAITIGEHDTFIKRSYLEGLTVPSLWGGSIRTIAGAGHCPQLDAPEQLTAMLGEYLDGLEA